MTNRDRFIALGRALHGARWQRAVSRDLGHNDCRRVQRWTSGEYDAPDDVIDRLAAIARQRIDDLRDALKV